MEEVPVGCLPRPWRSPPLVLTVGLRLHSARVGPVSAVCGLLSPRDGRDPAPRGPHELETGAVLRA